MKQEIEDLAKAAKSGALEEVLRLLETCAELRKIFDEESAQMWISMLSKVCRLQHDTNFVKKFVGRLFCTHRSVGVIDEMGDTLLMRMVALPILNNCLEDLIKANVNLDIQNKFGKTAAMYAVECCNFGAFGVLVKHGADLTLVDQVRDNVLHKAAKSFVSPRSWTSWDAEIAKSLVECLVCAKLDLNTTNYLGYTPLMLAVKRHNVPLMSSLLDMNCKVNTKLPKIENSTDIPLSTVLHLYMENANEKYWEPIMLQKLLKCGAEPDTCNQMNQTPLVLAIKSRSIGAVTILLWANCSVNIEYHTTDDMIRDIMLDALLNHDLQFHKALIVGCYSQSRLYQISQKLMQVEEWYNTNAGKFRIADHVNDMDPTLRAYEEAFVRLSNHSLAQLHEVARNPLPLMHVCRMKIRQTLGKGINIFERVNMLGLPTKLKNYVMLQELEQMERLNDNFMKKATYAEISYVGH